jgi:hypothetical protein
MGLLELFSVVDLEVGWYVYGRYYRWWVSVSVK